MRPSRHQVYLQIAKTIAQRSTCYRRKVGCVLTDRGGRVLALGYNGVPSGFEHCIDRPCHADIGENPKPGEMLGSCRAIHAEANALLRCADVKSIYCVYSTTFPCMECQKLLLNTGMKKLIYERNYVGDTILPSSVEIIQLK